MELRRATRFGVAGVAVLLSLLVVGLLRPAVFEPAYVPLVLLAALGAAVAWLGAAQRKASMLAARALVLERGRLVEENARLLADLGRQADDARFLADAGGQLAGSLDVDKTLGLVAGLCVPRLADWCFVELVEPDGGVRRAGLARPENASLALLESVAFRPLVADLSSPLLRRLAAGGSLLFGELEAMDLATVTRSRVQREWLRSAGIRSLVAVPLVARGTLLGSLVLASAGAARRYGEADLPLLAELARRCAFALENARLYREAQDAIRLRDDFLSVAAHELRTPLTSLKLQQSLLLRQAGGALSARVASSIRQVNRLAELVESLLDVGRVEIGRLELQRSETDLRAVVQESLALLEEVLASAECPVEVDAQGELRGRWDAARLDQVLVNLIANSAKYAAGRPIRIRMREDPEVAMVSVTDEGIGIEPEYLPKLFSRFGRAPSSRAYGGLGLGLFLSREIVAAHGGTLTVRSEPGRGATFMVTLPRVPI